MPAITGAAGAFWGPARDVDGSIKPSTQFSQATMLRQDDNRTYIVGNPDLRYWDKERPITVEQSIDGESWEVVTNVLIQHAGGVVVFPDANANREVRVSGWAYELEEKLGFFSWTLTIDVTMHDATDFQSEGWTENISGNRSWTAQAEQHWRADEQLSDWIDKLLPVTFYTDDSAGRKWRYEGVGYLSQDALTVPQGEIVDRTLTFTGDGGVYPRIG